MMKPSLVNVLRPTDPQPVRASRWRLFILVPVVFLLGAVLAGVWFKYGKSAAGSFLPGRELSNQTTDLLRHLNSPVEIRFYSMLPAGSAPEALQTFSGRVDQLLSKFQDASDGKIRITRNDSASEANGDAATADGIHPFNLDKGDACFLGIAVASGGQKESLAQLQPEWEPALEYDLARAIARVTATPAASKVKASVPVSPETTNEIARLIPDINGTSLEDGIAMLREGAVNKFTEAGAEVEKQIQAAQQQVADTQNGQSGAEQQAAVKHLQQVELEQGEKIKAIAARLQEEITVFQQMKTAAAAAK